MNHKITVYINPSCNPCKALKQWLWRNQVEFTEKDVINDQSAAQEVKKLNVNYTPHTVIETEDTKYEIIGADIKKIEEILSIDETKKVF
ncbi:glutaredoxin family protein [Bacillus subtilis]|uniref:glutaredoxin family protein n=1 Tax=Bacillus subtilis TaxID=1423 RepID=UPI000EF13327|nr:glutaredoxin family protein [Bacillus subtilis]AYK76523.1 glutaredoxin family protein [Bacillus subtilis subsp. subtilis]AYL03152.1 glutaredoxin family protein [Bacillus subtilis subsp. subtilis]MCT6515380.1 glutaredoxin family protein [Bacillus subtilis]MEC0326798.1 glutaredoxin family protein [Bacillus subtilis]MEC0393276.1 glutaredoxin family protein [Bacillus subtilis]